MRVRVRGRVELARSRGLVAFSLTGDATRKRRVVPRRALRNESKDRI